jgi:hypothetical protein
MKTERRTYTSPFPRKESNDNVLKHSRPVKFNYFNENNNDKAILYFEIPPSVTKSYMNKNTFYFDVKHFKETIGTQNKIKNLNFKNEKNLTNLKNSSVSGVSNNNKSSANFRPQSSNSTYNQKMNRTQNFMKDYSYCTVEKDKLKTMLNGDKNLIIKKPLLSPEKDKLKGRLTSNDKYQFSERGEIPSKDLIERILNSPRRPTFQHKNFGTVPE